MNDNTAVLQSLIAALDQAPDRAKEYLVGYAEGIIAARTEQRSA